MAVNRNDESATFRETISAIQTSSSQPLTTSSFKVSVSRGYDPLHYKSQMSPFVFLLLLRFLTLTIVHGDDGIPLPTEYKHTLSDFFRGKILGCSSLPFRDRLLCELEGALDAQARPNHTKPFNPSDYYPPPTKEPCKFREENIYGRYPYLMPSSPALERMLEKYVAMHSRCRDAEFDKLDELYTSSKGFFPFRTRVSEKPICQYVIWKPGKFGFGNRLLGLISSFLYAIMSARVLLVDYPEWSELFCEPFWNSSIRLPPATKLSGERGPYYVQYRDARCGSFAAAGTGTGGDSICNASVVNMVLDGDTPTREYEFVSCPMGYARLRNVPFVTFRRCNEYLVPGFYVNPLLSPLLDALFPQRNPFHLLSRFLYTPSDDMWGSIKASLDTHFRRRIGVQLREFERKQYTAGYDGNVVGCMKKGGEFLPREFRRKVPNSEYIGVYVATLVKRHLQGLNSSLEEHRRATGIEFRLHSQQLDTEREIRDIRHHKEAMVDIWALSMSHVLITSKGSTFGYVACGLAGVAANFLENEEGKGCLMGLGVEPCLHVPPESLSCQLEEPTTFHLHDLVQSSSTVRVCNDRGWGLTTTPAL